ncbi:MAG TPA: hypothetical protein VEI54_00705 [Candidatus Limnocylindrales bacterium]|nr:hypothetical protein [Candidatus Limnocylindrales bacterium]
MPPIVTSVRSCNPRKKKTWTYEQAESRRDKAERFTRDVLDDPDRADEIADMTPQEYAEERGVELVEKQQGENMYRKNASRKTAGKAPTVDARVNPLAVATQALSEQNKLQARVRELEDENRDLNAHFDEILAIVDDESSFHDYSKEARFDDISDTFPEEDEEDEEDDGEERGKE